ncbi:MAG: phosphatase PAP2 family protein [Pseudomonadota bacterium]
MPYYRTPGFCALLFIALVFIGRTERAREFATLLVVGAFISIVVGSLMPAEAAMMRYDDGKLLQIFGASAGVYHMETLQALRGTGNIVLTFGNLPGLITFPSYHTITGLLFAYACRDSLYTLVPASLWTAVMLITTPVYGGHYFIDILAGGAVTLALIAWGAKAETYRIVWRRPAVPAQ